MTTRANLKIESLGLDWHEAVQLFRGGRWISDCCAPVACNGL